MHSKTNYFLTLISGVIKLYEINYLLNFIGATMLKSLEIICPAFELVTEDPILNLCLCVCV